MCGEKWFILCLELTVQGSPPHVRGKDALTGSALMLNGDHPRMCGEKTKKIP